ncbi:MAG: hypothetical protein J1E59_00235 [Treponema sp.]|nr:hypothetical protein [Treponema sp.]
MEVNSVQDENFTDIVAFCMDGAEAEFSLKVEEGKKYRLAVALSDISFGSEKYNESFLASLRKKLKSQEASSAQFVIWPLPKNVLSSDDDALEMTAAFKHLARRLKDCENVTGFAIPRSFLDLEHAAELTENFVHELAEKHPDYVFFRS